MEQVAAEVPWFGIEQEYFVLDDSGKPMEWIADRHNTYAESLWSKVGLTKMVGFQRELAEVHCQACVYAGVKIDGFVREETPGQWEFQIGPCEGVEIGDHLWVARYLLQRVAEMFGVEVSYAPKPLAVDKTIPGCGAHLNFSTKKMREENGLVHIEEAIKKLCQVPKEKLLKNYDISQGEENKTRLTGEYFNPSDESVMGVADKFTSTIRIPKIVSDKKCGYFEERRPAGNADPYTLAETMVRATLLDDL